MPTLEWIGKEKVINHHQQVPFRVLEKQYTYGDGDSENMIIHGDNLDALKALLPRYEGKVKCIYIDPPYNTGNEGWVYNDNVNDPKIRKWLGEVVGKEGEDLTRHDKWLCMMYPRLKLLQKLLAEDGAIFISIGDDEQANLRLVCDEIFGSQNFIATFVWKSRAKPSNTGVAKVKPQNDAEYIFCYGKSQANQFRLVLSGKERSYPHHDEDGDYRLQTILKSNRGESKRETMTFELDGYTPPPTKRWQAGEDTIRDLYTRNRITFQTGEPMLKYYRHEENDEFSPFYCFVSKDDSNTAENGKKVLNAILGNQHGFDTVKPVEIIQYVLKHTIGKDAIILDSFAGSGTTAHAVLNMNKADGGHRRFILIEMEDYADSITAERVKRVIDGYGEGKNAVEGTGGSFSYYELGEPLLIGDCLNEAVGTEKIREYVWYMETRQPYLSTEGGNPYFLGSANDTGYYFYYEPQKITVLDYDFLSGVTERLGETVIYSDRCAISADKLKQMGITFKKIPRDISKL
ncbi:MAG: site-specific DNA-methyltransferase [Butyricicoccus pullicaecorum]|nr:site-specific DNA-methyltransferase [Butyricicoccus pullicaecorum]